MYIASPLPLRIQLLCSQAPFLHGDCVCMVPVSPCFSSRAGEAGDASDCSGPGAASRHLRVQPRRRQLLGTRSVPSMALAQPVTPLSLHPVPHCPMRLVRSLSCGLLAAQQICVLFNLLQALVNVMLGRRFCGRLGTHRSLELPPVKAPSAGQSRSCGLCFHSPVCHVHNRPANTSKSRLLLFLVPDFQVPKGLTSA